MDKKEEELNIENISPLEDDEEIILEEPTQEEIIEELIEESTEEPIEEEAPVPNAPEFELPHPMINHYNYVLDLESRILKLEHNQDKLIDYIQQRIKLESQNE